MQHIILVLAAVTPALAGMRLDGLIINGKDEKHALRGATDPGDLFHMNGGNRFYCGGSMGNLPESAIPQPIPQGEEADAAALAQESRGIIKPGQEFTVDGLTNDVLMNNVNAGGKLSYSYLAGFNPNFFEHAGGNFAKDGGTSLGTFDVAPWPPGSKPPQQSFTQNLVWPQDTYNGSYVVQALFRPKDSDYVFAQCIDLDVHGGLPLPAGCTDLASCPGVNPSGHLPPDVTAAPSQGALPPAGGLQGWEIALIVIFSFLLLALIVFIVYWCFFRKKPAEKEYEPPAEQNAIPLEEPEPLPKEPSVDGSDAEKDSDSGVVQIQYTDPVAFPAEEPPAPESSGVSGESAPPEDGSHGRTFHFRYVQNDGEDDGSEHGTL